MKKIIFSLISLLIICSVLLSCSAQNSADDEAESEGKETEQKVPWQKRVYCKDFVVFDADGDGVDEHVIEHDLVAMTGGHGGYDLYIYQSNGEKFSYEMIFDSNKYLEENENLGVQITECRDGKVKIYHPATQYTAEYVYEPSDSAYSHLFNEDGSGNKSCYYIRLDTFKSTKVVDVDGDGAEEIEMRQFSYIGWHSNYIGDCVTVWKSVDGAMVLKDLKFEFYYD